MNALETPLKNIVLIGFMGCGKSTIGRELHHRLGYPLVDMDALIEQNAGMPIREIFALQGEPAFREMESNLLMALLGAREARRIISTGGGVICSAENRRSLRKLGYVVWLHAPLAVIQDRTSRNRDRPLLLGPDAAVRAAALMKTREPWYAEAAHVKIETEGLNTGEIAAGILESARYFFTGHTL
jgi:shikimate kinase